MHFGCAVDFNCKGVPQGPKEHVRSTIDDTDELYRCSAHISCRKSLRFLVLSQRRFRPGGACMSKTLQRAPDPRPTLNLPA